MLSKNTSILNKFLRQTVQIAQGGKYTFASYNIEIPPAEYWLLKEGSIPSSVQITGDEMVNYFKLMTQMRRLEVAADQLYKQKEIRGFCHLYDGQEAVLMGIEAVLNKQDPIITAYRNHCHALTRGFSIYQILAELMGKKDGATRAKGGSMHFYNKDNQFYGGNGIVGAQIPVGIGLAFSLKYQGMRNVAIAMYGDGASNQGQLFEGANMAALWKLPVILVCENNGYGMGTSNARSTAVPKYYARDVAVPGIKVNGMNVFAMKAATQFAKDFAMDNGPIFMEATTYRYHGHSMSDPGLSYRSRDEVQKVRELKDPINFVKKTILDYGVASENDLKEIEKQIRDEVNQAIEKSRACELPNYEDTYKDIYIDQQNHYIRGVEVVNSIIPGTNKHQY